MDSELEDIVLASCFVGEDGVFDIILDENITEECFANDKARKVFSVMQELYDNGKNIDIYIVSSAVKEKYHDMSIIVYIAELSQMLYSTEHVRDHCALLRCAYLKRETSNIGIQLIQEQSNEQQDELIRRLRGITDNLIEKRYGTPAHHVSEIIAKANKALEKRCELFSRGEIAGATTGLKALDDMLGGWKDTHLNIIAGRPAMGKTAVAIKFALSAAMSGKSVVIFSLEMGDISIFERMVLSVTDLNADKYRKGNMTQQDVNEYNRGVSVISQLPIYIDDTAKCTTGDIMRICSKLKVKGKCDMIIVDYLQLVDVTSNSNKNYNREQQITKASRDFKIIAKEIGVPVLLLSQLSRAVETRVCKKPMLSDLRESGSIEQDADTVTFIYRPSYYGEDGYDYYDMNGNRIGGTAILSIAKQRDGRVGDVLFDYNESLTQIRDSSRL